MRESFVLVAGETLAPPLADAVLAGFLATAVSLPPALPFAAVTPLPPTATFLSSTRFSTRFLSATSAASFSPLAFPVTFFLPRPIAGTATSPTGALAPISIPNTSPSATSSSTRDPFDPFDDPAERASQITAAIVAWREAIADLLRAALPPDSDLDAEALADHVFVTFEGAFILCRATGDPGHMRRQLGALRRLFEVLLVQGAA